MKSEPGQCEWEAGCDEDRGSPEHPNSPHCARHQLEARTGSQRRSRERKKAARDLLDVLKTPRRHSFVDGTYTGPLGIAMTPDAATAARDTYGALLVAVTNARTNTKDFTARRDDPDIAFVLDQLREVAAAVADLNEVLGPTLYGPAADKKDTKARPPS